MTLLLAREGSSAERVQALSASLSSAAGPQLDLWLEEKEMRAAPEARFVKFSLALEEPAIVESIEAISCDKPFSDGIDLFAYPGYRSSFSEGGKTRVRIRVPASDRAVQSVALVFRQSENVCLEKVRLFGRGDKELKVVASKVVAATPPEAKTKTATEVQSVKIETPIIDRELAAISEDRWIFRFRSDGTFFIRGFDDEYRKSRAYSALGKYEVVSSKADSIKLKLSGRKVVTAHAWDGVLCPEECGGKSPNEGTVNDELFVEEAKGAVWMVRNRTSRSERGLQFEDLKTKTTSLAQ